MSYIPFNRPFFVGTELDLIQQAIRNSHLSGDGPFTEKCQRWLAREIGCLSALLTHSCTAALEMAAILADIHPGDEIVMPSFTFVSTANAFVLQGGIPVFLDIRSDTLNIDESELESAITSKTKAIVVVHYAGVACEMDTILGIAKKYGLIVIEDAAHAFMCTYKGRPLGGIGDLSVFSFHETKNVSCGEGGVLLINHTQWEDRAKVIRQKGTNRTQFEKGEVDRYTWIDIGSSYSPSEITAAFLLAQLKESFSITRRRLEIWKRYNEAFYELEAQGKVRGPVVPPECQHNAHMYYLLLPSLRDRTVFLRRLDDAGVNSVFHYIPLHSSPAGKKYGRTHGELPRTQEISNRLVRLPLWVGMTHEDIDRVIAVVHETLR